MVKTACAMCPAGCGVNLHVDYGRIEVRARVTDDIMSGIVSVGHAWPEASENVLTDDMPADPLSGYPAFAGVLCRIKKKT